MTKKDTAATQARLQSIIKESRNIMRKDAGLNGELDRLPQLAWLLFLKAFDDLEDERGILDEDYQTAVPETYRWRNWVSGTDRTGDPLLLFVNENLIPALRGLRGSGKTGDPRDTLANVFSNVTNRMRSGYLLRQLIDKVDQISFSRSDELHAMAVFYESMLKEMRDAAGDSGEFYTPRPLIRFIVRQVDPQPGEAIMDPAVGTGGFLVEAYRHAVEGASRAQVEQTQARLRGVEKKPMPYMLCQMNMLLNGIDRPRIVQDNSLRFPLSDVKRDGVDVVVTNPPFGGEEEHRITENFPTRYRTAETAWLFLQSVMARIERSPKGRCGIVVPNSVLFDTGVGGRVKQDLMKRFNLHTVVRLPNGVFAPYTIIPSNVLFFEHGKQGPVWFYEIKAPEGRKNYTKTKPMRDAEFAEAEAWWGGRDREGRVANAHAWQVPFGQIKENGFNLDLHNPHHEETLEEKPPKVLIDELINTERELLGLYEQLRSEIKDFEL